MEKPIIGIIWHKSQKQTLKEILDKAFESSNLEYKLSKKSEASEGDNEEKISEAIKNTPKLEVELNNVDYYA